MKPKLKRTWKRQLAGLAFVFWVAVSVRVFFYTPIADLSAFVGIYSTMSLAVWGYIAAAFGLHAMQENGIPIASDRLGGGYAE